MSSSPPKPWHSARGPPHAPGELTEERVAPLERTLDAENLEANGRAGRRGAERLHIKYDKQLSGFRDPNWLNVFLISDVYIAPCCERPRSGVRSAMSRYLGWGLCCESNLLRDRRGVLG